jgi:hypothetical protein
MNTEMLNVLPNRTAKIEYPFTLMIDPSRSTPANNKRITQLLAHRSTRIYGESNSMTIILRFVNAKRAFLFSIEKEHSFCLDVGAQVHI